MRFFLVSLRLELLQSLFSRTMLILLLAVALPLSAMQLWQNEKILQVHAAVVFERDDETAAQIFSRLPSDDIIVFTAYEPSHIPKLEELVASGRLECAFIIPTGLRELFINENPAESIELIRSPRTTLDVLLSELVFSSAVITLSADITLDELAKSLDTTPNTFYSDILELYSSYSDRDGFVKASVEWSGEAAENNLTEPRIPHGILALIMLVAAILCSAEHLGVKKKLGPALSHSNLALYYIAVFGAALLRLLTIASVGLLLIQPASSAPLISAFAYAFLLAVLAVSFSLLPSLKSTALYTAGAFTVICCAVLGGVLISPAELGGIFTTVSVFMPSMCYLAPTLDSTSIIPVLLAAFAIMFVVAAVHILLAAIARKPLKSSPEK